MAPTSPTATSTTTLVFAKLDPILQGLLAELTALKGIIPSVVSTDRHEATLVRRFRNIAGSLEALSRGVQSLIWEKGETSNSVGREPTEDILLLRRQRNEQCTKSLCLLADYVTLPLTAIFHLSLREIFVADVEETHKGDEWQRTLRIRRSYVFQMHRLAASAIRTYVEATSLPSGGPRLDETSREDGVGCGRNPSNLLPSDTRIKYLVALIQSMPSFLELNETTSTTTTTTTTTTTIITTQGSSLDDGSDSWVAILETAQSLLATFRSDRDHPDTDARGSSHRDTEISHGRLLEAWYGTLSMRLVDCLTAFLANHPAKNNAPFFSPLVRRAALATLGLLLKITMEVCGHGPSDGAKNGASQPSLSPSSFWRSVFPGVFAALYQQTMDGTLVYGNQRRSEASSSSSSLRIELQAMSLDSLIVLFRATLLSSNRSISNPARPGTNLLDEDSNSSPDGYSDTNDLLARLTSMVATVTIHDSNGNNKNRGDGSGSDRNEKPSNKESDEDEQEFFRRVKHRVEGPLLAVLRKLSVSTSDDIRRKVVLLCKVLLLETEDRELWRNTSDDGLRSSAAVAMPSATVVGRVCFELCIGFQHDPDATVRTSSREIIERYIQCCKRQPGGDDSLPSSSPSDWMVPRTIELIQTLSALVHKGVDAASSRVHGATPAMELRAELNLVAGYLQFLVEYKNRETASKKHTGGTKESNGIAMTTTMDSACIYSGLLSSKHLQHNLIQLFDVDFDSWKDNKTNLVSVVIGRSEEDISSIVKLRYFDHPDLMHLARDSILRTLGELLGPKHGAIFVDEVMADLMEASFHVPKLNCNHSSDDSYICWLHEWIGSLVVAREVLLGSFSAATADIESVSSRMKQKKSRNRILHSLASYILPLLVGSSIWHLPIENRLVSKSETITNSADLLSPQTVQRNSIVVVLLVELIGVFSKILRRDVNNFLVHMLYPIIDKTIRGGSTLSVDRIQNAGLLTLKMMAYSCGLQNIEDLINTEHNQLVAAMVGRLRLLGGSKTPKYFSEAEEISHITKNATWIIGMMTKRIEQRYSESGERVPSPFFDSKQKTKSSIVDLVSLLDYRLDHLFLQKIPDDADVESICSLHKVLYDFFLQLFDVKKDHIYSYQMKNVDHGSKPPWLNLLSQFRKSDLELQDIDNDTKSKANEGSYLDINKTDITLFAKLVARDCYLLSSQSMKSRVSTCNAMTSAFKFLAFVGSEHDDPTDDTNLIRNTVLRQVAESWPSIRARLKTLSAEVSASSSIDNSSVVLMLSQSRTKTQGGTFKFEDLGVKRIFLAKLFELIGIMCQCSGDFFADRFRHDVWPIMACHLEKLLKKLNQQRDSRLLSYAGMLQQIEHERPLSETERTTFELSDTECKLIVSILKCLHRVVEQKECGKAVDKLLSSIGFTLLPFVDIEDKDIQELSMNCIRSIMRIDCDVLRRPLMELSGTRIPTCLGKFRNTSLVANRASYLTSESGKNIIIRCNDLLNYANFLPEQVIS